MEKKPRLETIPGSQLNLYKGKYRGREFEVSEDLSVQIDPGPMLSEYEKDNIRSLAMIHFSRINRYRTARFVRPNRKQS